MIVGNISALALLPAELRAILRIKRRAELVSGLKLSIRDPQLFKKLEDILKGLEQDQFVTQLCDLEAEVSLRINGPIGSFKNVSAILEIDEEDLADGSKVTVENHKTYGVRIKYYDYSS